MPPCSVDDLRSKVAGDHRIQRMTQFGKSNTGSNRATHCDSADAAPMYSAPARSTLRRLRSAKDEGLSLTAVAPLKDRAIPAGA